MPLAHDGIVLPRFHYPLGYRKPAEVAYKYATVYVFTM